MLITQLDKEQDLKDDLYDEENEDESYLYLLALLVPLDRG